MYVTLCVYVFGMSKENKISTPDHRLLNANSHLPTNTNRNEKEIKTHTQTHTQEVFLHFGQAQSISTFLFNQLNLPSKSTIQYILIRQMTATALAYRMNLDDWF